MRDADAMMPLHPCREGLYSFDNEHDACGVGMLVNIRGDKSHELVDSALKVLENMKHRGAEGADNKTGDGAGIMLQIPHEFILLQGIPVPEKGKYGTGLVFLPKDEKEQAQILSIMIEEIEREGLNLMHLRNVPVNSSILGKDALATEPDIKQIFITGVSDVDAFERTLYIIRKKIENRVTNPDFYIVSLSSKNIVYKGMLTSLQLREYYPDLTQPYFTSGLAVVHSRFSTNTFPTWSLAQPFRLLAHNGEINTIRGNRGWMEARESVLSTPALGDIKKIRPIIQPNMSDSASLDNVLEFFVMSGLSLPHAMAMLVPESFNDKNPISEDLKAFYEYHSILMEPWDGPAALLFSDGRYAGGMLDRNGLRPARYLITKNDMMVVASEAGVINFEPGDIKEKGRLQPGKILLIDTAEGKIYYDGELKEQLATAKPYRQWLSTNRIELHTLRSGRKVENKVPEFGRKLRIFGFSREDIERTITPMCVNGAEPTASMGNDTPLAVLSAKPQILFNYFRQQFAQVTNPAIDPIREELVMSLTEYIGAVGMNILLPDESHCKMVRLPHPVVNNTQLDILCNIRYKGFNTVQLPMLFDVKGGESALREALQSLCKKAEESVDEGVNYIILTDDGVDENHAAIPSLLAVSAVHHHLISVQKRVQTALIVKSGEIREVMHAALLLGYGASAICPYMAFAVLDDLVARGEVQMNYETAEKNYIKAICKGLYKVMSKMGISTIRSYRGAKIFESVGISEELLRAYFGSSQSTIGGIRLADIARDYTRFHDAGYQGDPDEILPNIGQFSFRKDGEKHAWNPETISTLQLATRLGCYKKFKEFTAIVDGKEQPIFLRDFFDFKKNPISIDEVEPVEDIVKHFVTGAMSFGAISKEAHEALALAMNELGTRSNTGEGGEDSDRFHSDIDGISLCSKTKQIASGRFGVTTEYLVNAEEIQIKVAQGAKPGEGGQLPGFKVNEIIAKTRHSIPGISLISPPPHHDIYSIEDLAQLIFDLKNVNPKAKISVKLVAESGVGTIAAGVAKAKADLIVISGAEGGTGASPASSMRYAGIPPEIGLSETQQTLVLNGLRGQVRLQTDGQLKTGRDIISMALLGAEEFGFGTTVLIVLGCVMMRKCHQNTCPVGVATQDPKLREHFRGHYKYVVNYFRFLAQEVREYLAQMGYKHLSDIVGHTELIEIRKREAGSKASELDFSKILHRVPGNAALHNIMEQHHDIDSVKDVAILNAAKDALDAQKEISLEYAIANTDRSVGAMLSGAVAAKYGNDGLPEETINVKFKGSAGQSFGAFLAHGITFKLEGEANDYLGKGLSGGRISVQPPVRSNFDAEKNTIAGNTLLYGATSGEVYINGKVGERFAVRNSGAIAVVEGVGDHCCEYMTGGRVVVLGDTGRNFAAGMSGGVAYVWDRNRNFDYFCNMEMVELSLLDDSTARKELHELVRQHYLYTGSQLARTMLDNWSKYVDEFIQVTPIEYKRVLAEEQMKKLQQKIAEVQRDY
ncbi:MAG: glutamate synthase large subunit [Muribaculaceae bacterium]